MTDSRPARDGFVDLRSDTVTTPTAGMREAMAYAEVGDDVYGEDPTVNALEAYVAELLGHEAGLFCPSGSMTNMLGVRVLVPPGQELLCDSTAHIATGVPLREYGSLADTVSVCLSKGLGAPVGSVLVSSAERIAAARVWRKRYGGGMRQVGVLAAACRYALDHQLQRLADDHARARRLADAVAQARPELVDTDAVETNIVVHDLAAGGLAAHDVAGAAREHGVLLSVLGPRTLRMVTHLGIDDEGCEHAAGVLAKVL